MHKLADSLDYVVWVNPKQSHLFIWDGVQRENLSCIVLAYMENQVESTTIVWSRWTSQLNMDRKNIMLTWLITKLYEKIELVLVLKWGALREEI